MEIAGGPSDQHVRELANEILSNPPFDEWNSPHAGILAHLLDWLADFFAWMGVIHVDSPALYWLILSGMLLVASALLGHIVWSIRIALKAPPPRVGAATTRLRPQWRKEAGALASQGRFLEAAHRLALGSVQALVENGHIELSRSDANRILRERIRSARLPEELSAEFIRLLNIFEARWFRDRVEDPDLYEAWRNLHSRVSGLPVPVR